VGTRWCWGTSGDCPAALELVLIQSRALEFLRLYHAAHHLAMRTLWHCAAASPRCAKTRARWWRRESHDRGGGAFLFLFDKHVQIERQWPCAQYSRRGALILYRITTNAVLKRTRCAGGARNGQQPTTMSLAVAWRSGGLGLGSRGLIFGSIGTLVCGS